MSQSLEGAESVSEGVYVRLVPEVEPSPEPAAPSRVLALVGTCWQHAFNAGEWIGICGSQATVLSRLTAAAVGLVLVSGLSLLICPTETAKVQSEPADDIQLVEVLDVEPLDSAPTSRVVTAHAEGASHRRVQPTRFENRRGAWLSGTIETE